MVLIGDRFTRAGVPAINRCGHAREIEDVISRRVLCRGNAETSQPISLTSFYRQQFAQANFFAVRGSAFEANRFGRERPRRVRARAHRTRDVVASHMPARM